VDKVPDDCEPNAATRVSDVLCDLLIVRRELWFDIWLVTQGHYGLLVGHGDAVCDSNWSFRDTDPGSHSIIIVFREIELMVRKMTR
jgi:hypothetical protein